MTNERPRARGRLPAQLKKEVHKSALCRSQRELSNACSLAKFGFDTAENEPCKVCRNLAAQLAAALRNKTGLLAEHAGSELHR